MAQRRPSRLPASGARGLARRRLPSRRRGAARTVSKTPARRTPRAVSASSRRATSARLASHRRGSARTLRRRSARDAHRGAGEQLSRFRQATILAVSLTALLLLLVPSAAQDADGLAVDPAAPEASGEVAAPADTGSAFDADTLAPLASEAAVDTVEAPDAGELAGQAASEATGALRGMWAGFLAILPKLAVAIGILVVVWGLTRLVRPLAKRLSRFQKGPALAALLNTGLWVLGVGAAVSVVAGNLGALLGSIGLVGLALSWSLQGPIESFTGWLLNSFKGYYHEGDRIAVGDVVGDVYRIDVLNTLVWEIGGAGSPSGIEAEQPTGRLITFPNSEVVSGTVVNYSRDFPFVWDEVAVAVAAESDLAYASGVVREVAVREIGETMRGPAQAYAARLKDTPLDERVSDAPEVFIALSDWGANLVVRYLVEIRSKRAVKTELGVALVRELNEPRHAGKILAAYPRQQIQLVGPGGEPEPWRMGPAPG